MEDALECALKWFTNNCMIVNPGKFQSTIIDRYKAKINPQSLTNKSNSIKTSEHEAFSYWDRQLFKPSIARFYDL